MLHTELCNFFKDVLASTVMVETMMQLKEDILVILYKLEKIFPSSFYNLMEHLPIHLPSGIILWGPLKLKDFLGT